MSKPLFKRIALIGIGLIGSSISHAVRRGGLATEIVGHARSEATRATALRLGLISEAFASAAEAVRGADLVIMCTPVGAYGAIAEEIGPHLEPGAILTDVGSVKGAVVRDCQRFVPAGVHFIPGHPIAGTEHSGPEFGLRRAVRRPLVHPDAARRRRPGHGRQAQIAVDLDGLDGRHHGLRAP